MRRIREPFYLIGISIRIGLTGITEEHKLGRIRLISVIVLVDKSKVEECIKYLKAIIRGDQFFSSQSFCWS
jgi:hypothetical protein